MIKSHREKRTLTLESRAGGLVIVRMDDPDAAVNTLKTELAAEFERLLDALEGERDLKALVFTSGKPDTFLAGANLEMLMGVATSREAQELSRISQRVNNRLAALPVPKVAAIHGTCLGGGLELALAFDARVASDDSKTRLGLPEVQLGLLPGGGGTQRLPRLIGSEAALDLLLTGRQLSAERALKIGLVDAVVPRSALLDCALERARAPRTGDTFAGKLKRLLTADGLREWLLAGNPIGRRILFDRARRRTLRKTRGHYPAPERILQVVRIGLDQGRAQGLQAEAEAFGELAVSGQARELINIFFATTALKKDSGVDDPAVEARPVRKLAVLGGGLMGAGISYVTAWKAGIPVHLKDTDAAGMDHGLSYIREHLAERVERGRMSAAQREAIIARVTGTLQYDGFADADVVIEAVFEDLDLKRRVLAETQAAGKADLIFASNTSAIPIAGIAQASAHPETVIGMHYFSPVEKMPLLEVVVAARTAPWVTATCVALGKQQGKTVIAVRDGPGFFTSRVLAPYLNEAAYLLAEGVAIDAIDTALRDFGFPVGPFKLLDEIGIDVVEKAGRPLEAAFGNRLSPPPVVARLIADKRFGRKNRRGFYAYDGKKASTQVDTSVYRALDVEPDATLPAAQIAERCVLLMVNEAVLCFADGVLRKARDGDIGAVFGLGFPPFLGGPFRYVDAQGAGQVVARLEHYAERIGKRFTPAPLLVELAKSGGRFHGEGAVMAPGAGREVLR